MRRHGMKTIETGCLLSYIFTVLPCPENRQGAPRARRFRALLFAQQANEAGRVAWAWQSKSGTLKSNPRAT